MRVLHLVRALRVGGLEAVVVQLLNRLPSLGVEPYLGCLVEPGDWVARVQPRGLWVGDLDRRGRARVLFGLCRHLRRERIELIHSHNSQAHLFGVAASLLTGVPIVHTKHGQNWPDDPRWVWKSRQASRFTRRIVAVSEDIRRIVTDVEHVPPGKVMVIRNGVDVGRFQVSGFGVQGGEGRLAARKALGIPEDAFVVGSVGRLAWEKNYELLVDAVARLRTDVPEARLLLVGEGPYRARIEARARERGMAASCLLPGSRGDVPRCLAAMDVFCLSSLTEGTSITLLEAGAAGLPAVVTAVGGNAEVVRDGVTGLVVSSRDEAALADALRRLWLVPALRAQMGRAAQERVAAGYSVEAMAQAYAAVYRSALQPQARQGECHG